MGQAPLSYRCHGPSRSPRDAKCRARGAEGPAAYLMSMASPNDSMR